MVLTYSGDFKFVIVFTSLILIANVCRIRIVLKKRKMNVGTRFFKCSSSAFVTAVYNYSTLHDTRVYPPCRWFFEIYGLLVFHDIELKMVLWPYETHLLL